jgi:Protein of unknown function (DUF2946)
MHWFRLKIRPCVQLALFALAFQMAVSFGHMHRDDLGLRPLPDAGHAQTASITTPALNSHSDHQPASDDYCPICASMALVATAVPSLPPTLTVPETVRPVWPQPMPAETVRLDVTLSFRARAPPLV